MLIKKKNGEVLVDTDAVPELNEIDLREAHFAGQTIEGGDLSDGKLQGVDFSGADLYWTYMFRAKCRGCNFQKARLAGVNLEATDLRDADFTGAYVSYDNVGGATSLDGADLRGAKLADADLRGATYNAHTRFPRWLQPEIGWNDSRRDDMEQYFRSLICRNCRFVTNPGTIIPSRTRLSADTTESKKSSPRKPHENIHPRVGAGLHTERWSTDAAETGTHSTIHPA